MKLTSGLSSAEDEQHNIQCFAGIARTSIKLGDVSRGFNIAGELNDNQLILEVRNKILPNKIFLLQLFILFSGNFSFFLINFVDFK